MEAPVKTFLIPNDLCRRAGIAASWQTVNQIGIFPSQQVKATQRDVQSVYSTNTPVSIYQVQQMVILFHPILRRLVNEASGIFVNIQNLLETKPTDVKKELLQFSKQYRSVIRACLDNLADEVMRSNGAEKEELEHYVTIFYSVERIWHLCEILYIENIPGYIIIKHLLEWTRFHFPQYERKAAILLSGELIGLESHPDYWKTVVGSLLQGRIEIVQALLSLHSYAHTEHFKLADQAITSMPSYDIYQGISITEFNLRWKHWLVDTQSKIDAKMFMGEKMLDFIMRLIVGEEMAWNEVQDESDAWYEVLAGWLFYTEPAVKSFELGKFAKKLITRMDVRMHYLDRVLLAAMEGDVEIIKEIEQMTDNGWFVTHLTDLLHQAGQLEKWQTDEATSTKLRESLILEYGMMLMGHQSLWQIGLNYLDHCQAQGTAAIELLLPRIRMESEAKTNKIIREAQKRDMTHLVQSISKVQSLESLKSGRRGNALIWALKSQDANLISFLADGFLKEYINFGKLECSDLINHLGSSMLACDRLIFLGKYYEFHQLYLAKNFKDAATALISLIASKLTPKYFWCALLSDALPLLECDKLVFSSNDTLNLLNCLQERVKMPDMKDKTQIIMLAIARNLSRALIYEAQLT